MSSVFGFTPTPYILSPSAFKNWIMPWTFCSATKSIVVLSYSWKDVNASRSSSILWKQERMIYLSVHSKDALSETRFMSSSILLRFTFIFVAGIASVRILKFIAKGKLHCIHVMVIDVYQRVRGMT